MRDHSTILEPASVESETRGMHLNIYLYATWTQDGWDMKLAITSLSR